MNGKEFFISGIDTDCGKTYITGLLAYHLRKNGANVITTKLVQTGCKGVSEDLLEHRKTMEVGLFPEDESGMTCPFVFSHPASPHLAAKLDAREVDVNVIKQQTQKLLSSYEIVLTEGAGGLLVPIEGEYTMLDYMKEQELPLILVSSSKLGSINHTLMSLEICRMHRIHLYTFVYNLLPGNDALIAEDSFNLFCTYLKKYFPQAHIIHSSELGKKGTFSFDYMS